MRLFLIGLVGIIACVSCNNKDVFPVEELTEVRVVRKTFHKEQPKQIAKITPIVPKSDTIPVKPTLTVAEKKVLKDTLPTSVESQPVVAKSSSLPANEPKTTPKPSKSEISKKYHVITGSLAQSDMKNLNRIISKIESLGYTPVTISAGARTRISVGGFASQKEAQRVLNEYSQKSNVKDCWILYVK